MEFDPNKHHRRSIRLREYDYSQPGWYFITICTYQREQLFGNIRNGKLIVNQYGEIANTQWLLTEQIRKNVIIDKYVIMPNHLHGILALLADDGKGTKLRAPAKEQFAKPTSNTIPTIIRGFKSIVTKKINEFRHTPHTAVWQRNYYEHIIRDEIDLSRIRKYIAENPLKWQGDNYFNN